MRRVLTFTLIILYIKIQAQVNGAPQPCTSGTQNTCKCSTSPILCSIEDLDGYEYDMTTFQHPGDGPTPMCPPPEGTNTSSQNPTWFAFLSWCTSLTIKVTYTNCTNPPGPPLGGVQAAVYSGCPATTNNAIACDTDTGLCNGDNQRIVNINGMIPGNIYYFLVDGCSGSACHIKIDVIGSCSQTEPTPLTTVTGPRNVCKPNAGAVPYFLIKNEFTQYNWFIDGTQVAAGPYLINPNLNFNSLSPGIHQVCVDGSLPPCIALNANPSPLCFNVCVSPSPAEAGNINGNMTPCPNTPVNVNITGNNTATDFKQYTFVTDPSGNIIEVVPNNGTSLTLNSPTCTEFKVYSLNYYEPCVTNMPTPTVGQNVFAIDTTCVAKGCACELSSKTISFQDNTAPVFVNPPASGTFSCILQASPFGPLNYTDNCLPPGSVPGTETSTANPCDGGVITREWSITDLCNNTKTHTQTLTVGAVTVAAFVNPPPNITVTCSTLAPAAGNLGYSNGGSGPCLISGVAIPTVTENFNACAGGTITHVWTFTDNCNRTITYTRTITISPSVIPAFVSPPADITVACNTIPPVIPNLSYTNNMASSCLISGSVAGAYDGPAPNVCGGVFFIKWTFTDPCNRTIMHTQKITVTPVPEGNFVNPPADITVNCNAIPATGTTLNFSNGLAGACMILNNNVVPTSGGTGNECGGTKYFAWSYTDACGRTKVDTQFITITPILEPNFVNPPANITVSCENNPSTGPNLTIANFDPNCPINSSVAPVQTGSANQCGGTITYTWNFTDQCNRFKSHTQTVTVQPMPQAQFVNPPANITVNCNQVPSSGPQLQIQNTGTGNCNINQMITPVQSGSGSMCGGTITYTWTHVDACNRTTTHVQNLTVNPPMLPQFVNPPANITVNCNQVPSGNGPSLMVKNNDPNCPVNTTVAPTQSGTATQCGGTITYMWTFTDPCNNTINHTQTVTVTPLLPPTFQNPPANITVNCNQVPSGNGPSLTVVNNDPNCPINTTVAPTQSGTATQCGGTITYMWTYTDVCNRTINHTQTVTVTPLLPPTFQNPPANITVNCNQIPSGNGPSLTVVNNDPNCPINTTVAPTQSGTATQCGGTITYMWTYTDVCNRTINHTQTVTVLPPLPPVFQNPPSNITVNCELAPSSGATLTVANNDLNCPITGSVVPTQTGSANICGGSITYTWTFTDVCNRTITHSQTITVLPAPLPTFVNPPANITVNCNEIPSAGINLNVTNNGVGACLITSNVAPVASGSATVCGGVITYTWTYTDQCQRTITHVQSVTVTPMPLPQFVNPPANTTVSCANIPSSPPNLQVVNNGPTGCIINESVTGMLEGAISQCGGSFNYKWIYTDICNRTITHVQTITVTPTPQGQFQNPPSNELVECNQVPPINSFPNLTISNGQAGSCAINESVAPVVTGSATSCGGVITVTWSHTDFCGRITTHVKTITVNPAAQASFSGVPGDITVDCGDLNNTPIAVNYNNNATGNCNISGSVSNVRQGNITACGGNLLDVWTFTDPCGRTITSTRNITVNPAPAATFTSTPQSAITIDCEDNIPNAPLAYGNNESGVCGISGTVAPTQSGSFDACGGVVLLTWTFTDICNRSISFTQTVTIQDAPDPTFINPPIDEDLPCGGQNNPPAFLQVSNGISGACGININAPLVNVAQNGTTYTNTWEYVHPCTNQTFSYTQTTTVVIAPQLVVDQPEVFLCPGESFDLTTIQVTDLNNTNPVISYHASVPANASNEIDPMVTPNPGDIYYIKGLNAEGCEDVVLIYFIVEPQPNAGGDGVLAACNNGSTYNLNSLLNGGAQNTGSWIQVGGNQINLSNPVNTNFIGVAAGSYNLKYIVEGSVGCPNDTANFVITVTNEVEISLAGVLCIIGGTYEVKLVTKAPNIVFSTGFLQKLTNDTIKIYNIAQGNNLTVTVSSQNLVCNDALTITSPDCSCPFIAPPTGVANYGACTAASVSIPMSVTVPNGLQANWYDVEIGGTALLKNSLSFSHTNQAAGIYNYYVETYNPSNDCYSITRLKITIEIYNLPQVNPYQLELCDADNNSIETFDLGQAHSYITSLANAISFHLTESDANNGVNGLPLAYTNMTSPQVLYAAITSSVGCKAYTTLTLLVNPTPTPNISIIDETCNGKKDGSITASAPNGQNYTYSLNSGPFTSNVQYTNLEPSNYLLQAKSDKGCIGNKPFVIKSGLILNFETLSFECNSNGTLSNSSDDYYTITIKVINSQNQNGSYKLTTSSGYSSTYNYNSTYSFTIPANGNAVDITAEDSQYGCKVNRNIGPLTTCSTTCVTELKIISSVCNNNNTTSDPQDDTYTVSFSAVATNGSSTSTYNLYVDNVLKGTYMYGVNNTMQIPATGVLANIKIVDAQDLQCSDNVDIGPLTNCSSDCFITAIIESIDCVNPSNTPSPGDDIYEVVIKASLVNGGNSNQYKIFIDNVEKSIGNYNQSVKITLSADDKVHNITLKDAANNTCVFNTATPQLSPCSGPCEVEVKIAKVECSSNNTTNNSTDDSYTITLQAKLINGTSSSEYIATIDGKTYVGKYAENLIVTLPADGKSHLISIVDKTSTECKGSISTDLLLPCSVPCNMSATILTFDCNNGGTTSDNTDDQYQVSIQVSINGGGGSTQFKATSDGKDYTGEYGKTLTIPYNADNKTHAIQIIDLQNGACNASITTPILAPCSGPCEIDVQVTNIICDNNGTNNTALDDIFYFDVLVTGNNTKWKIKDTQYEGTVNLKTKVGPISIASGLDKFLLFFENSPNCKKEVSITKPNTCSECKQKVEAGIGGQISCTTPTIALNGSSPDNGSFAWYLGNAFVANGTTLAAGQPGKYYFVGTFADGCQARDSVEVTIDSNLPLVTITRNHFLSCDITSVTITATATGTGIKYEWTDESGAVLGSGLTLTVNKEGKYYFRAYNESTGCSSAKIVSEVVKNIKQPSSVIYAKPTTTFDCVIKLITLFNDNEKNVQYTWSADGIVISNEPNIDITKIGNYTLTAIDTLSGCENLGNLVINNLIEYPIINLTLSDTLDCTTSQVYLSAQGSQTGSSISYAWKDKNKNIISTSSTGIDVKSEGIYYLELKDSNNGCSNTDTIEVPKIENEIELVIPQVVNVINGETASLNVLINIPKEEIAKIEWDPKSGLSCTNCLNPTVVVTEDVSYKVKVTDIYGCIGEATVRLQVVKPFVVTIPNIISPQTSTNGGFTLYGNDQVKLIKSLKVFDRWGNLMFLRKDFAPNDPSLGWNGSINGKEVEDGVYVYLFQIEMVSGLYEYYSGDVTVIKR